MDIRLSISLLASDRKESLMRCLDSLKPLLARIPAELIIILTSTEEAVRRIAEQYTPQIIPFSWCSDFSAARNTGLEAAQGEWFLYIDDDEWFDDTEEICQFFLSGEYRDYHSAHYIQRNYQNWNGTQYSDFSAFRMVRRLPGTRFQGTIHEELTPRMEPCKYFGTCVHHYGYVESSGSLRKTSRNIPLLLRAIGNDPLKVKNYIQLAKESDLAGDRKSAEKYCRMGLEICREAERGVQKDTGLKGWLLAFLSCLVSENPGNASGISEIETILSREQPSELIRLVLYQQLVHLYAEEEPKKAVQYGRKFEGLLDHMDETGGLWTRQGYGEFDENYIKSPERLYGARAGCAACALKTRDWDAALYFLKLFPWETEDILQRYYPFFEQWKEEYSPHFPRMLSEILEDRCIVCGIGDVSEIQMCQETGIPSYLLLQKARDDFNGGKQEEGLNLILYCMVHMEDGYLRQLCLNEALCHETSIVPLAAQMDLGAWNHLWETAADELPFALNSRMGKCAEEIGHRFPLHSLCVKRHGLGQKLHKGFPLWSGLTETLEDYCRCILEFYRGLYREEWLTEDNAAFLPAEYGFARISLKALEALRAEQTVEAVRLLRDAFHIYPEMTGVIIELTRQAVYRMNDPAKHADAEFLQLAGRMKDTLRTLMASGQTAQAAAILDQLLPLLPDDLELIRIRQEVIRRTKV